MMDFDTIEVDCIVVGHSLNERALRASHGPNGQSELVRATEPMVAADGLATTIRSNRLVLAVGYCIAVY